MHQVQQCVQERSDILPCSGANFCSQRRYGKTLTPSPSAASAGVITLDSQLLRPEDLCSRNVPVL